MSVSTCLSSSLCKKQTLHIPSFPFQLFTENKNIKMSVNSPIPEPGFDLNSSFVPLNISEFLKELCMITDVSERAMKIDEYVLQLQDELNKVQAFKRELPLCMILLKDGMLHIFISFCVNLLRFFDTQVSDVFCYIKKYVVSLICSY